MKIRVDDRVVEARLDSHYAHSRYGHAMLVLEGNVLIEPSFALLHDYRIVNATRSERAAMKDAGYELTDDDTGR